MAVRDEYVSVVGGNYLQPIAYALSKLVERTREGVPGMSNSVEIDWSATAIVLGFAYFEGTISWTHYHRNDKVADDLNLSTYYRRLRELVIGLPDLADAITLRNALAHNHLWLIRYHDDETIELAPRYGGTKKDDLPNRMDAEGRTPSGLHLVPTMIDRYDTKNVLCLISTATQLLAENDLILPNVLRHVAAWPPNGRRMTFAQLVDQIA